MDRGERAKLPYPEVIALLRLMLVNVGNGSKAALTGPKRRFRFAPINGHRSTGSAGPFRANNGRCVPAGGAPHSLAGTSIRIGGFMKPLSRRVASKSLRPLAELKVG
jgi:hypothetical protein